ncbi:hypothetical protein [uncultured Aliiroseovarius sp.]|uniref:hypothetical protein n=1 Tax=uncultured Aliiroseovarius sp. TaxID=1658783 RepID=UPI00260DB0AD|nr:hypothetical protein [uncultured Aliiroseovarius sp.]
MYILIADEADQDGQKQFLVFAAVFFPSEKLLELHKGVESLRADHGYVSGDVLKSSPMTKPEHVSRDQHAEVKNKILKLAADTGCKICCYVVPHAIAKGQSHEDRLKFGTNTILTKFDQFLSENGGVPGLAFFDHTKDYHQKKYLREVFELGIPWKDGSRKKLEYVVSVDDTGIGHSHLASICDIVVGAFRFVANEPDKDKVGKILLKHLSRIMWGRLEQGKNHVRERGLCIRPRSISHKGHQADIEAFVKRLVDYSS